MVSSISNHENRQYYVGLVAYYIEGTRYTAFGFSVDADRTPDIHRSKFGFVCTALFPPENIDPAVVSAKGIMKIGLGDGLREAVSVKLEVMDDDVWSVAEFINGVQEILFVDPAALQVRFDLAKSRPH
jgi:hypothetical protein